MPAFDSAVLRYARYDALRRELLVRLTGGSYVYEGVPPEVYEALLTAPSKGAFYNAEIRDRFAYKR
ncbi:MAG: KTSC domain-containing protein [Hyphomonadaceae bacterium]